MYELKCPFCSHVSTGAFVRIGAVIHCPQCGHRYRIHESHVKRLVQPIEVPPGSEDPLLAGAPEPAGARTGERLNIDSQGNVIGLSGLSEMMRREHEGPPPHRGQAPPTARVRSADRDEPPPTTAPAVYIAASILGAAIVLLGAAIWIITVGPRDSAPMPATPLHYSLAHASKLTADPWTQPNAPYHAANAAPGQANDAEIRLVDERIQLNSGAPRTISGLAVLDNQVEGIVVLAHAHLSLVDRDNVELAHTTVPVPLLGASHPRRISVPMPEDLSPQWLRIESRIEVEETLAEAIFFDTMQVNRVETAVGPGLEMRIHNPGDRPVDELLVLVTGLDAHDRPAHRWQGRFSRIIDADETAQVQIYLAELTEAKDIDQWQVDVVGRPMDQQPAAPDE